MKNISKINQPHVDGEKPPKRFGDDVLNRVRGIAETLCESEGMELVHLEFQREAGGRTLRVYIDKPGGVKIDDCVHISRELGDLLDVYLDGDEPPYNLEVSSPGPERPVSKPSDFERFAGRLVKIKTRKPFFGQKTFTGTLLGMSEGTVRLECQEGIRTIPHGEIQKAKLVPTR